MGSVKRLVLLANSRKHSGRCIAGKELLGSGYGPWVRPISERPSAEVSLHERSYENGKEPQILDIVEVPLLKASPSLHQTENHLIDSGLCWLKKGELKWTDLDQLIDHPNSLWGSGQSSYYGLNDRVTLNDVSTYTHSLALIEPVSLNVTVDTEGEEFGNPRRRVRASFSYQGIKYSLAITDPIAVGVFRPKSEGAYPLTNSLLCVSLGEVWEGYCYKLVATVVNKELLAAKA